jgi:hypothetical protein
MTTMTRKSRSGMEIATQSQMQFAGRIANPTEVLAAIERGHAAVAAAANNQIELGAAVAGTWIELAELEGDEVAEAICDEVWPLDTPMDVMAVAA